MTVPVLDESMPYELSWHTFDAQPLGAPLLSSRLRRRTGREYLEALPRRERERVRPLPTCKAAIRLTTRLLCLCRATIQKSIYLLAVFCILISAGVTARAQKSVIIFYSHEREIATYEDLDKRLLAQLNSNVDHEVTTYREYLDLMRFADNEQQQSLTNYLQAKYRDRKIDLVFAISPLALNFLLQRGSQVFPGIPIVFASVNVRTLGALSLPTNITGVAIKRNTKDTLDVALRLQPDTIEVVIPTGNSTREQGWIEDLKKELEPYQSRLRVTWLSGLPMQTMLGQLGSLREHTIVLFANLFFYDGLGRYYRPEEALDLICQYSSVPVYSTNASYLGTGVVGGHMLEMGPVGDAAGKIGRRILAGEVPSSIPVQILDPNGDMFDARQLHRWGIDQRNLPPGSTVVFSQPSLWKLYKPYIVICFLLLLLQAWLIFALVMRARRLKKSEAQLRDLSKHLIHAQDEERKRIARELHDDFAQRLAAVSIDLDIMQKKLVQAQRKDDTATIASVRGQVDELTYDIHDLSHTLHSSKLQYLGLRAALKELCSHFEKQHSVRIELQAAEPFAELIPEDVALCFYRIVHEALQNAVKHGSARRVIVHLSSHHSTLRIKVSDTGSGFDPTIASEGLGLVSMRERLRLIGGEFKIHSKPGQGTELTAQVRLEEFSAPQAIAS